MRETKKYPEKITIEEILKGCQCTIITLAGENTVIKCVTCPIHGDIEFRDNCIGCSQSVCDYNEITNSCSNLES